MLNELREEIKKAGDPQKVKTYMWFFKTDKGQYGEGDEFLGITVPVQRKIAVKYKTLPLGDIAKLLESKFHEERLIALLILVAKFNKGDGQLKKEIYDFYLAHTKRINNWDLVDLSADKIIGNYLLDKDKTILLKLAQSDLLWEKRIAIIATFAFIKNKESEWTFAVADILLHDKHDLIHKAVGWMLREVGEKVSQEVEKGFLNSRYKTMPRTMLRYAIEKFPEELRKNYLKGEI